MTLCQKAQARGSIAVCPSVIIKAAAGLVCVFSEVHLWRGILSISRSLSINIPYLDVAAVFFVGDGRGKAFRGVFHFRLILLFVLNNHCIKWIAIH